MYQASHEAKDQTSGVEKRHRAAYNVSMVKLNPVTDEAAVVDDVTVYTC